MSPIRRGQSKSKNQSINLNTLAIVSFSYENKSHRTHPHIYTDCLPFSHSFIHSFIHLSIHRDVNVTDKTFEVIDYIMSMSICVRKVVKEQDRYFDRFRRSHLLYLKKIDH